VEARTRAAHARHYKESPRATQEKMQKSREKLIFVTFETEFFFFCRFDQNHSGTIDNLDCPARGPNSQLPQLNFRA
jgi:hypothetical protein